MRIIGAVDASASTGVIRCTAGGHRRRVECGC
jgi:hypothetical protein